MSEPVAGWRFVLLWVTRMRWWLLIIAALALVYTVGAPKDVSLLQWVKDLLQGATP